ncbi:DEAD/DEAH box helicase [Tessaracoccus sp. OS52]|uniref:DEAD/DEAH box helicase n=1 Tax=Tessaracoccus sp. OS52 TaxID=2886691 RepID=UPI001D0FB478|nr:DEAD/DEAH box helicase [Tessaracoccus sp. OS52]MCC2594283.1 DEAD/DEAH box helicase [Tessaracoccus sp. OS52]
MSSDFARLGVPAQLASALAERGITSPTPIQAATLPDSLAGRDVLGRGRTGSGKSFAFLLPMVARLSESNKRKQAKKPRALILAPTRELATQLHESLVTLEKPAGLTSTVVFGGVGQNPQAKALQRGVDVLIACPGRLLDLMGQNLADLSAVEITVIDEADHMADMGFLPGVRRILQATPGTGQRMLFSATLDAGVNTLVKQFLHNPVTHEADSELSPVGEMDHHVLRIDNDDRTQVLAELAAAPGNTIIFTRTKHGAKKLAKQLLSLGVPTVDLHGNLSQNARTRNMDAFHSGRVQTLVATDIAARGIHVDDVALVVHADPPTEHKAYLHRSGRTARAGNSGTVVTLELPSQRNDVRQLLRQAKINPTFTNATPGHEILSSLAPGARTYLSADEAAKLAGVTAHSEQQTSGGGNRRPGNGGGGRRDGSQAGSGAPRNGGGQRSAGGARRGGSRGRSAAPDGASSGAGRSAADFSRSLRSR